MSQPSSSSRSSTPSSHVDPSDIRTLSILYATETGTAQDVADRLARLCRCLHIRAQVHNMDTYRQSELINEYFMLFIVSTTGSGREPRAMTPLWQMLLRADLPEDLFEDLTFAVFGLGDASYEKFCWPAKLLSRRLVQLGAHELCARGEGDEQHHLGIDGALGPWIEMLSAALLQIYPVPDGIGVDSPDSLPPPRVAISDAEDKDAQVLKKDPLVADREYHTAELVCHRRITASDWHQDVRHFEFELDDNVQYGPGDVAVIHPEARPEDVEALLSCIGFANVSDDLMAIRPMLEDQSLPDHLPTITTLREILTRYVDINAVPRRSFFALLQHFAQDDMEREKLTEFLSVEGTEELYEYCHRPRRTIREVLEEFRSARIPREYIFDLFPPLRPRQFSIASSIKVSPFIDIPRKKLENLLLKLDTSSRDTPLHSHRPIPNDAKKSKKGRLQKGFITLPEDPTTPVICIGPGTGVAPMRAVIQERVHAGTHENTLYFGCRSEAKDHHYGEEWTSLALSRKLTYRAAFSRDGPEGKARTYVQDLIHADAKQIWELVGARGAWVYISGSSNKMPAAVRASIAHAVITEGGRTEAEAKEFVAEMEREGRLIEECWT